MRTKTVSIAALFVVVIAAIAAYSFYRVSPLTTSETATSTGQEVACTREAKICPDGSSVGREGPSCEFAACPAATSTPYHTGESVTVTARIGQTVTALGEKITPVAVLDDSRCPVDVQCIWAGTVKIRAQVVSGMGTGDLTIELNKESTTEVNSITLVGVSPAKSSTGTIRPADYIFTFKVVRR